MSRRVYFGEAEMWSGLKGKEIVRERSRLYMFSESTCRTLRRFRGYQESNRHEKQQAAY
jgi:hypothetical protein